MISKTKFQLPPPNLYKVFIPFPLSPYLIFPLLFVSVSTLILFGRKLNFIFSLCTSLSLSLSVPPFCPLLLLVSKCVQREIKANAFLTLK